jgi:uncharacterized protein YgfB (UPF0149 family)
MASLKDATQLTEGIESLVNDLRSELEDGDVDFEKLVSLSDQISERADGLAETFNSVNEALMQRIDEVKSGSASRSGSKAKQKAGSRG